MSNAPGEGEPRGFELIRAELARAVEDLFEDYNGVVRNEPSAPPFCGELALASIGFTSEHVRGSLSIVGTIPAVRVLQKAFMDEDDDSALESTIGEYSNMLLGRLKNRVLAHGLVFKMATPTTSIGSRVQFSAPELPTRACWLSFVAGNVTVAVRLDAVFEPGFHTNDDERRTAMSEGTVLIFDLNERKVA